MMRGTRVGLLAVGLTAAGCVLPAAESPEIAPQTVRPIQGFSGEVVAVDERSVILRGFGALVGVGPGGRHTTGEGGRPSVAVAQEVRVVFPDRVVLCTRAEYTRERMTLILANGEEMVLRRADQPARRFPASGPLATGGFNRTELGGRTYRLSDIRVGDEVAVKCERVEGVDHCATVQIVRRPGGRVPPAPGEAPGHPRPYHETANALQDWEDTGVEPPGIESDDQVAARVAESVRAQLARDRTAPEPREVTAKPKPKP